MSDTGAISASDLRVELNDVLSRVSYGNERVTITRNGKPAAVLVSVSDLELLERLEDAYWGDLASERLQKSSVEGKSKRRWRDIKEEQGL